MGIKTLNMEAQKEIQKIKNQIVKNYKPEKIILFGSFAYGKPNKNSDLDLLIIKNTKSSRVKRIKDVLMKVDSDLPLEPLVYTPKELACRIKLGGDFFIEEVIRKGKIIYEK